MNNSAHSTWRHRCHSWRYSQTSEKVYNALQSDTSNNSFSAENSGWRVKSERRNFWIWLVGYNRDALIKKISLNGWEKTESFCGDTLKVLLYFALHYPSTFTTTSLFTYITSLHFNLLSPLSLLTTLIFLGIDGSNPSPFTHSFGHVRFGPVSSVRPLYNTKVNLKFLTVNYEENSLISEIHKVAKKGSE